MAALVDADAAVAGELRKQLVERFGAERVAEGGLKVYTTIDGRLQAAANRIRGTEMQVEHGRHGEPDRGVAALEAARRRGGVRQLRL